MPLGVKVFGCGFGLGCGQPTPRPKWLSILSTIDCIQPKFFLRLINNLLIYLLILTKLNFRFYNQKKVFKFKSKGIYSTQSFKEKTVVV